MATRVIDMKKIHNITFSGKDRESLIRSKLQALGIKVNSYLINFKIDENHPQWFAVKALMKEFKVAIDMCHVQFTHKELRAASWLAMKLAWHHGYPQPEDKYREETYNLRNHCEKCGIGKVQKRPFHIKGEPKWGKRQVVQLNWVFDEYFVKPDVYEQVFKPKGIECIPVIHYRTGKTLETVVQLKVDTIPNEPLDIGDFPYEVCPKCHRKKYFPILSSAFPPMKSVPRHLHAVKSQEHFGSGAAAFQAFFISQALYAEIYRHKLKGVDFVVVEKESNQTYGTGGLGKR